MKDNRKTTSERLKELDKAVKALDRALHDMAKSLSDFFNVIYRKGLEKCSQEKTEIKQYAEQSVSFFDLLADKKKFWKCKIYLYLCTNQNEALWISRTASSIYLSE